MAKTPSSTISPAPGLMPVAVSSVSDTSWPPTMFMMMGATGLPEAPELTVSGAEQAVTAPSRVRSPRSERFPVLGQLGCHICSSPGVASGDFVKLVQEQIPFV